MSPPRRKIKSALESNREYAQTYHQSQEHIEVHPFLQPLLEKTSLQNIIDLGCGDGAIIDAIHRRYPEKSIMGVDLSEKRIRELQNRFSKLFFLCADVTNLPLKNQKYDLVISNQVIEHVDDDQRMISEIKRLTEQGSYLFMTSVIKKRWALYKFRNRLGKIVLDPTHEKEYSSPEEFERLFRDEFELEKMVFCPVKRKIFVTVTIPGYREIYTLWRRK